MTSLTNTLKQRLLAGESLIGAWLGVASTPLTEIAGQAGFDWCLLDSEHGVHDHAAMRDGLVALKATDCPSAVRIASSAPWMMKQALDIGAQTVVVPMIESVGEAESVAQSAYYPPTGNRGLAAGVVRASGYGAESAYAMSANENICLMLQIESRAGVDAVEEIARVDGADCLFIGPSDLAADMGFMGNPGAPEVQDAIKHIMSATLAAGKHVGFFCLNPGELPKYHEMGARFFAVASDVVSYRTAMSARAKEARAALDKG